jgi:TrmH family RNA methyltransferase
MTPQRIAVVLVRPRESGNVGMACRAMANMGLAELRLVEPAAELDGEARMFAVGAGHVLEGVERFDTLAAAVAPFRRVVGTTSARDRRLAVDVITPRRLPEMLAGEDAPGTPTALVFGSEVGGLNRDELALCSPVVTVPCAPEQPTLNLAQSVLILAYELHVTTGAGREGPLLEELEAGGEREPPAPAAAVDGLFGHLTAVLEEVGFARDTTFDGVLRDLRQLAARARPSEREVTILRGILRRIRNSLRRGDAPRR